MAIRKPIRKRPTRFAALIPQPPRNGGTAVATGSGGPPPGGPYNGNLRGSLKSAKRRLFQLYAQIPVLNDPHKIMLAQREIDRHEEFIRLKMLQPWLLARLWDTFLAWLHRRGNLITVRVHTFFGPQVRP